MKTLDTYLNFLLVIGFIGISYAQQQPNFLFYQQNMSVINPAYSGSEGSLISINYSSSWVGVNDAPKSATFVYNSREKNNASWGFSYLSDKVYVESQGIISVDFSYRLQLSENTNLHLGLKGGSLYNSLSLDGVNRITNESNSVLGAVQNFINPLFGIGAYVRGEKAFVGISVPNVLNSKRYKDVNGLALTATDRPHFYMSGGLSVELNDQIGFEPSFIYRFVNGAPNLLTAFANINFNDKIKVGTGVSNNNYISGLLLFSLIENMDVGYGYEMGQRNSDIALRANTHELLIKYKFL